MKIVGCDFHPSFQQVAILDISTGEVRELKLMHATGEAERFYRELESPVLIGMESMGNSLWFERLMEQLGHELWIGDAAQIRASYVRRQKTDKRDAGHILTLLMEKRFPRIWVPSQPGAGSASVVVASSAAGLDADASEDGAAASGD
jgi:transposase